MVNPTQYDYKKALHFQNGLSEAGLEVEIKAEKEIGKQLDGVGCFVHPVSKLDYVRIEFLDELTDDEETALLALFPKHDPSYKTPQEVVLIERVPHYGGADTFLNGRYCKWKDGEWAAIEWTLPEQMSLTSAIISIQDWPAGDVGFTTVANPQAMWPFCEPAAVSAVQIDLGPNSLVDVGVLQGGAPVGLTISDLYDPDHPLVQSDVWVEFWHAVPVDPQDLAKGIKRTKTPGLRERHRVKTRTGSVLEFDDGLNDPINTGDTILIPEYSTGFSPDVGCVNPFLEGEELQRQADMDARHLSGGMYFVGGSGNPVRLGSPDRSEATEPIPAGLCLCIRVYGGAKTGDTPEEQQERCLALSFEMRAADSSPL